MSFRSRSPVQYNSDAEDFVVEWMKKGVVSTVFVEANGLPFFSLTGYTAEIQSPIFPEDFAERFDACGWVLSGAIVGPKTKYVLKAKMENLDNVDLLVSYVFDLFDVTSDLQFSEFDDTFESTTIYVR